MGSYIFMSTGMMNALRQPCHSMPVCFGVCKQLGNKCARGHSDIVKLEIRKDEIRHRKPPVRMRRIRVKDR